MWVADQDENKIFAYQLTSGVGFGNREPGKDIALDGQNADSRGIWSDGTTIWVADEGDDKLYTYALASIGGIHSMTAKSSGPTTAAVTVELRMRDIADATVYLRYSLDDGATWEPTRQQAVTSADARVDFNLTGLTNGGPYTVQASLDGAFPAADTFARRFVHRPNNPAEGAPTVSGAPRVGETLTADTTGITDADVSPDDVVYTYQWIRLKADATETDIAEATGSTYVPVDADLGLALRVRVGFTDSRGFEETVVSAPTAKVRGPISGELDLDAPNGNPWGIWSNGSAMWVADHVDQKLYVYTLSSGRRDSGNEFNLANNADADLDNGNAQGIWSDGTTIWVADVEDDKLYAYPLNSGRHDSGKDITLPRHHETPRGVWGNDTTIWVAEDGFTNDNKIHAYNRSDGSSDPSKDFTKLDAAGNQEVRGIWSNGATMWVADDDDDKLFAYQLTPGVGFGNREPGKDIALDDQNADPRGIWSDGTTMWVADEGDDKLYTYALPSIGGIASLAAESTGPTTATVTVELRMRDITAATLYLRHSLDGGATWGPTQQQAVSSADASVDLNLTGLTNGGHYTVQASLDSAFPPADTFVRSFTNRPEATFALDGTNRPVGLWMNSVTIWVADDDDDKIYAYQRSDGSRDPDKDFDNLEGAGNKALNGIWSDGRTMFVVDRSNFTLDGFDVNAYPPAQGVYAYKITPGSEFGARDTGKEFYLDAFNANPRGIWGDANTIWVTEDDSYFGNWIFAYQRPGSHSLRDPARDFTALADGDGDPRGLWSDGQTMWVADDRYNRVRAYGMSTRGRRASMDVVLSPGNGAPTEIWSDGEVLWVLDREDKLIYPYYLPQLPANNPAGGQPGIIGTAQVRRTVTADTSAITDADGISAGAAHTYQWIRVDGSTETAIAGATGSAYVITGDDLGLTLKVRVGFVDDLAYRETAVSEASAPVEATVNMPATGQPTIIGTAWVDLPLMADTSAIADGEGIPDGAINYQWIRVDGSTETAVAGATGSAYMLGAADAGRTIKVRVSFADGLGFQESVDSDETAPVLTRSDDGDGVWTATMTVGRGTSWRGYDEDEDGDTGSITNNRITTLDGVEHTLGTLIEYTGGHSADDLELVISPPLPGGFDLVMGASRFRSVHAHRQGTSIYRWLDMAPGWEIGASVVVTLVIDAPDTTPAPDNSPATGAPAITGRVYVGQRLRVDTSAITDANGIPEDAFSYQWVRADGSTETDIAGAAGSSYIITLADLGKTLKVRVGFTDGAGFGEGPLTSAATAAVPTAPGFPSGGPGFALASANARPGASGPTPAPSGCRTTR